MAETSICDFVNKHYGGLIMPKGYHHLTYEERCQIYTLLKRGDSHSSIAEQLDVHRSTIFRELKRNTGRKGYRFRQAQEITNERRQIASGTPKKMNEAVIAIVKEKLSLQWSPEQISGWMKLQGTSKDISYETIYRFIWKDKHDGGVLHKQLRHRGKKYNKRGSNKAGRGCIPGRIDIRERPAIVEEKTRLGDIELDTIQSAGHTGAIVSMVDRASKLTKLVKVSGSTAEEVTAAIIKRLDPIKDFVYTLTADNGKEFASHFQISTSLDASFFFATPYHSWERGLNEHTNGLVRQYFPKGSSFAEITQKDVLAVENLLNNRPRKVLGYQTPAEVFRQKSLCYTEGVASIEQALIA
jgi:transposase, IS30 family